jgi:hypothetical protein
LRQSYAQDLLWPLPDSRTLTGGFADSRPDHFHGGVDLRTSGQNLPVVAPADGWIERMAVTPNGYGRALYFRLPDGRTAVFGHLSRFEPGLETLLRDSQLVVGTYRLDLLFDSAAANRSFHRGDTLAYTGSTGIGPPHCHVEIRKGSVQTDPLANFDPRDQDAPVIVGLWWTSLSKFSPLNTGNRLPLYSKRSQRQPVAAITSAEPVALFVQAYDPGPWGRNAVPTSFRLQVNDRVVYADSAAQIDLTGAKNIYQKLVNPIRKAQRNDVRRLFSVPPSMEFLNPVRDGGGWIANVQNADVLIEVEDRAGNVTAVHLTVNAGNWPQGTGKPLPELWNCGLLTLQSHADPLLAWTSVHDISNREIEIQPDGMALGDRAILSYTLAPTDSLTGLYFYQRTAQGGQRPLWRALSADKHTISCSFLHAGVYGVGVDSQPPQLRLSVRGGKIAFRLTDSESAVDDGSIRCTIDGQTAIAEFEYEERGGLIWTKAGLGRGMHEIEFSAADRAGNTAKWRQTIFIP